MRKLIQATLFAILIASAPAFAAGNTGSSTLSRVSVDQNGAIRLFFANSKARTNPDKCQKIDFMIIVPNNSYPERTQRAYSAAMTALTAGKPVVLTLNECHKSGGNTFPSVAHVHVYAN